MNELQKAVRRALDEWRDDPGSVRMASLMIALEDALAASEYEQAAIPWVDGMKIDVPNQQSVRITLEKDSQ